MQQCAADFFARQLVHRHYSVVSASSKGAALTPENLARASNNSSSSSAGADDISSSHPPPVSMFDEAQAEVENILDRQYHPFMLRM